MKRNREGRERGVLVQDKAKVATGHADKTSIATQRVKVRAVT